jgi:hypothetical protein
MENVLSKAPFLKADHPLALVSLGSGHCEGWASVKIIFSKCSFPVSKNIPSPLESVTSPKSREREDLRINNN